jgi:hypothetical protein
MLDFSDLETKCVVKPKWQLMAKAYQAYFTDRGPCKIELDGDPIANQCAVRMSIALERCGFSLNAFGHTQHTHKPYRVHRNRSGCQVSVPHVLGAKELMDYLKDTIGLSQEFHGDSLGNAAADLSGKHGIIYFNNCFTRGGQSSRRGDHIDLWDGVETYNKKQRTSAGGGLSYDDDLFAKADRIWFIALV